MKPPLLVAAETTCSREWRNEIPVVSAIEGGHAGRLRVILEVSALRGVSVAITNSAASIQLLVPLVTFDAAAAKFEMRIARSDRTGKGIRR